MSSIVSSIISGLGRIVKPANKQVADRILVFLDRQGCPVGQCDPDKVLAWTRKAMFRYMRLNNTTANPALREIYDGRLNSTLGKYRQWQETNELAIREGRPRVPYTTFA